MDGAAERAACLTFPCADIRIEETKRRGPNKTVEGITVVSKKVYTATAVSGLGLLAAGALYGATKNRTAYTAAITMGTAFYHLAMRLAVGWAIDIKFHNHMDYRKKWFRQRAFEPGLYRAIKVKSWKRHLPAFRPENFRLVRRSPADIIRAGCQAEIVHELIMVFSLVPILFRIWFGAAEVFFITSCLAALFDGMFAAAQRFNRPRLLRLVKEEEDGT